MLRLYKLLSRTLIVLFGILVSSSLSLFAEDTGIFVVSAIYSIKPDGTCIETKDGKFGNLAKKNGHWDSTTKAISLYAAKNEEVGVQIVIPIEGKGYTAQMSELKGNGVITSDRASFSIVAWATAADGGMVSDLVIPLDGTVAGIKAVDVPIAVEGLPAAGNKVGVILFELWVPKTAIPGIYNGKLKLLKNGAEFETLSIKLTVLELEFPDTPSYAFDLLSYGLPMEDIKLVSGSGVPLTAFKATELAKATINQIYKLSLDNRCFLNVLPYHNQRGTPHQAYPVSGQGASATIPSYAEFDDFFAPLLDGKLNKYGKAPAHFTLAFNVNYPHICNGETSKQFDWTPFEKKMPQGPGIEPAFKEYEETNKAIATLTFKHFAEKGWKDTTFEFYHNQKGDAANKNRKGTRNRVGNWKLDEPVTKNDYEALRYLLNINRWSAESAKDLGIKTANRLDIGHWHCDKLLDTNGKILKDFKAKEYDTADAKSILEPVVDHWVIGIIHMDAASHCVKDYEKPGRKIMSYATSGYMNINNCGIRGEGFKAALRGTIGQIIIQVAPIDPNLKPKDNDFILYSGKSVKFNGALCPKRLKLWRDAVNDFEYVFMAKAKNPLETKSIIEKLAYVRPAGEKYTNTRSIAPSNNPEDYLSARLLLTEIITGKKMEGVMIQGRSEDFTNAAVGDEVVGFD